MTKSGSGHHHNEKYPETGVGKTGYLFPPVMHILNHEVGTHFRMGQDRHY